MQKIKTDAIRVFQERVNRMTNSNQKELTLSAIESRNLGNELAQLTAFLLEITSNDTVNSDIEVVINSKF
mgnify:CR=1 FL=1|jgi:hypothetical protein